MSPASDVNTFYHKEKEYICFKDKNLSGFQDIKPYAHECVLS